MRFHSILFDRPGTSSRDGGRAQPSCFADLNLDQLAEALTYGREEYDLKPFFYAPLRDVTAVGYRHEILRDLETGAVSAVVREFTARMQDMRKHLEQAEKLRHSYQRERWFLDAVELYCTAVSALSESLAHTPIKARGFLALRDYLTSYSRSDAFHTLATGVRQVTHALSTVKYSLHIKGSRIRVSKYNGEQDYSTEVEKVFAKFKQGAVKDYRVSFQSWPDMNHVEARILDLVARLYPDVFQALDDYCTRHSDYLDTTIERFDREVQFYLAYLDFIARLKSAGLPFCYPHVSTSSKDVRVTEAFDLALAAKLIGARSTVVCNDFYLRELERVLVVTGPNQGGKTTFARMFGQLHYLASLGYPVPGREAQLFLPDRLFTHFEKQESIETLSGKLEDELNRLRDILRQATSDSIIIMNESFTSTTLRDALLLGKQVMRKVIEADLLCVCVTFVDELASLSDGTVSMVGTVVPGDLTMRTFKIVRKPADGLAHATAIAEKYALTYQRLKERIAS